MKFQPLIDRQAYATYFKHLLQLDISFISLNKNLNLRKEKLSQNITLFLKHKIQVHLTFLVKKNKRLTAKIVCV